MTLAQAKNAQAIVENNPAYARQQINIANFVLLNSPHDALRGDSKEAAAALAAVVGAALLVDAISGLPDDGLAMKALKEVDPNSSSPIRLKFPKQEAVATARTQ